MLCVSVSRTKAGVLRYHMDFYLSTSSNSIFPPTSHASPIRISRECLCHQRLRIVEVAGKVKWGRYPVLKKGHPCAGFVIGSLGTEFLYLRRWQIVTSFALTLARSCGLTKKAGRNQGWHPEGDFICTKSLRTGPREDIVGLGRE